MFKLKQNDIAKIARYLKVSASVIKEVLVIQFSKNLDQIIDLSKQAERDTDKDCKLMARWNELFFDGVRNASSVTELEYFRNKYPPDNKQFADQKFSEKLNNLEISSETPSTTAAIDGDSNNDEILAAKKTNDFVEKIIAGIRPAEYKAMYEDTQDEIDKARILKDWKMSYHINIKYGETIEQVKEALENSPYKYIDHEKFIKFSKKAIKKWATLTKTPAQAVDLDIYRYEKRYIYSIDDETKQFVFQNMFNIISTHIKESENKQMLRNAFEITDAPDVKAEVIKKVCNVKSIGYGQIDS